MGTIARRVWSEDVTHCSRLKCYYLLLRVAIWRRLNQCFMSNRNLFFPSGCGRDNVPAGCGGHHITFFGNCRKKCVFPCRKICGVESHRFVDARMYVLHTHTKHTAFVRFHRRMDADRIPGTAVLLRCNMRKPNKVFQHACMCVSFVLCSPCLCLLDAPTLQIIFYL